MTPKRRAIAGGLAAVVLGGGVTTALLIGPSSTSAASTPSTEPPTSAPESDEGTAAEPEVSLSIGLDADALLDALVESGVITQEQADTIGDQLAESAPEGIPDIRVFPGFPDEMFSFPIEPAFPRDMVPPGRVFGRGFGFDLESVADAIGIDESELRQQLIEGDSIAEIAEANGVDPQTVIDALVADYTERVTDLVQGGDEQAPDSTEPTESPETTTSV
jgi:hypothetical protein